MLGRIFQQLLSNLLKNVTFNSNGKEMGWEAISKALIQFAYLVKINKILR